MGAVRILVADVDEALPGWLAAGYAVSQRWGPPFAILTADGMPDLWLSGPGTSAAQSVEILSTYDRDCAAVHPVLETDDLTERLDAAFHEHQGRGQALGHRAIDHLVDRYPGLVQADSPWHLDAADPAQSALIDRFLTERVAAAVAARPELRDPAQSWLERRRTQLRRGRLTVRLEHTDVWLSPQ